MGIATVKNKKQKAPLSEPILIAEEPKSTYNHRYASFDLINAINSEKSSGPRLKFIDLFCGIGGFRFGFERACKESGIDSECVFSSDIDPYCQIAYNANFGETPYGDITKVNEKQIPDFDVLLGGFPCQAFSIIGKRKGFEDTRGTLFFDIARIISHKKPKMFILENVKQLRGHDGGRTIAVIEQTLRDLGYDVQYKVLNALDFGLPQKRERIWIVGSLTGLDKFTYPRGGMKMKPLEKLLEKNVDIKHYATEYIVNKRRAAKNESHPHATIWHENKNGNIGIYPYSCALRAGASYNYLLVNGERRLTVREMLRLQGFPEKFKIVCSESQTRKQAGNSLPVNVAYEVSKELLKSQEIKNAIAKA